MKKLIAKRPVLYRGRAYEAGEDLPAYDGKMVDAWLRAGSAELIGSEVPAAHEEPETPGDAGDDKGNAGEEALDQTDDKVSDGGTDVKSLAGMSKDELEKLAADMGVELPRGAAKALIVEKLAAVSGQ